MRDSIPEGETLSREHLANERTLLSWMRTGINAISVGILLYLVAGTLGDRTSGEFSLFGLGLVVFGVLVEVVAAARFMQYRRSISRGSFTPSALVYLLVVFGLLIVGVAYIGYVVVA